MPTFDDTYDDGYGEDGEEEKPKEMTEENICRVLSEHLTNDFVRKIQRLNEFELFLTLERCNSLVDAVDNIKGLKNYPMRLLGLGCPTNHYDQVDFASNAKEKSKRRNIQARALVLGTMTIALIGVRKFGVNLPPFHKVAKMNPDKAQAAEVDVHDWVRWWRRWYYTQPANLRNELLKMFGDRQNTEDWLPLETWAERKAIYEEEEEDSKLIQISLLAGDWDKKDSVEERLKKIQAVIGKWTMNAVDAMTELELFTFIETTGQATARTKMGVAIGDRLGGELGGELTTMGNRAEVQRYEAMLAYGYHKCKEFGLEGNAVIDSTTPKISHQIQAWLEWWTKWIKGLDLATTQKLLAQLVVHDEIKDVELPEPGEWRKSYDPNQIRDIKNAMDMFEGLDMNVVRMPKDQFGGSTGSFGDFLGL